MKTLTREERGKITGGTDTGKKDQQYVAALDGNPAI